MYVISGTQSHTPVRSTATRVANPLRAGNHSKTKCGSEADIHRDIERHTKLWQGDDAKRRHHETTPECDMAGVNCSCRIKSRSSNLTADASVLDHVVINAKRSTRNATQRQMTRVYNSAKDSATDAAPQMARRHHRSTVVASTADSENAGRSQRTVPATQAVILFTMALFSVCGAMQDQPRTAQDPTIDQAEAPSPDFPTPTERGAEEPSEVSGCDHHTTPEYSSESEVSSEEDGPEEMEEVEDGIAERERRLRLIQREPRCMQSLEQHVSDAADLTGCRLLGIGVNVRVARRGRLRTHIAAEYYTWGPRMLTDWYHREPWLETLRNPRGCTAPWPKLRCMIDVLHAIRKAAHTIRCIGAVPWELGHSQLDAPTALQALQELDEDCSRKAAALGIATIVRYEINAPLPPTTQLGDAVDEWLMGHFAHRVRPHPNLSRRQHRAWQGCVGTADLLAPPGYSRRTRPQPALPPPPSNRMIRDSYMTLQSPMWKDDPDYAECRTQWRWIEDTDDGSVDLEPKSLSATERRHVRDKLEWLALQRARGQLGPSWPPHMEVPHTPPTEHTIVPNPECFPSTTNLASVLVTRALTEAGICGLPCAPLHLNNMASEASTRPEPDERRRERGDPGAASLGQLNDAMTLYVLSFLTIHELETRAALGNQHLACCSKDDALWYQPCISRWNRRRHEAQWKHALISARKQIPEDVDGAAMRWRLKWPTFHPTFGPLSPNYGSRRQATRSVSRRPSGEELNEPTNHLARKHYIARELCICRPLPVLMASINVHYREIVKVHVFEPRYRWMLRQTLEGPGVFALASRALHPKGKGMWLMVPQRIEVFPDGRADVQLLPVAQARPIGGIWSEPVPGLPQAPQLVYAEVEELELPVMRHLGDCNSNGMDTDDLMLRDDVSAILEQKPPGLPVEHAAAQLTNRIPGDILIRIVKGMRHKAAEGLDVLFDRHEHTRDVSSVSARPPRRRTPQPSPVGISTGAPPAPDLPSTCMELP